MKTIVVQDGQSLVDIAIQATGSTNGLVDIAMRNRKSVTARLRVGEEIIVEDEFVRNKDMVAYFVGKTVSSQATMYEPLILFAQNMLVFDDVIVGQTNEKPLLVKNIGRSDLVVTSLSFASPAFSADVTSFTLAPDAETTMNITFSPTVSGNIDSTLKFYCNNVEMQKVVNLVATAIAVTRVVGVSPTSLAFGTVETGSIETRNFTITNTGNSPLLVMSLSFPFPTYTANWNSGTIAPAGSQVIMITYAPILAEAEIGNIVVNSNATNGVNTLAVTAEGFFTDYDFNSYNLVDYN